MIQKVAFSLKYCYTQQHL